MAAPTGIFVTGTDTGVGKTWISLGLMMLARQRGLRVAGMKPVAAGCVATPAGLVNEDASRLRALASTVHPYSRVNPYAFEPAVAPHLAAAAAGVRIAIPRLTDTYASLAAAADLVVVEGIGGWQVPLSAGQTVADLARALALPVVLVVGLRLGCLNHALLSAESILKAGAPLAGWAASTLDPRMPMAAENVLALRERLPAPCLGVLPWLPGFELPAVAAHLSLPRLPESGLK